MAANEFKAVFDFLSNAQSCTPKCYSKTHLRRNFAALTQKLSDSAPNDDFFKAFFLTNCWNFWRNSSDHVTNRNFLHWAASCDRSAVLEWLLVNFYKENYANFGILGPQLEINAKDLESGYTPLHMALLFGNLLCAQLLIKHGASLAEVDNEGLTPIDLLRVNTKDYQSEKDLALLYAAGENVSYNLGHSNAIRKLQYEPIEFFQCRSLHVKQVAVSNYHTLFLTTDGHVFSCGHGAGGRLGLGDENAQIAPRQLTSVQSQFFTCLAASNNHSLGVTRDGDAYSWGDNSRLALGHVTSAGGTVAASIIDKELKPRLIQLPKNFKVTCHFVGCAAANNASILWSQDTICTFGENVGHLGHSKQDGPHVIFPKKISISTVKSIDHVVTSNTATVIIAKKGDVYLLNDFETRKIVNRMLDLKTVRIINSANNRENSHHHTKVRLLLLTTGGQLYQWHDGSDPSPRRTVFNGVPRMIYPSHVTCNTNGILLVTEKGGIYSGQFVERATKANQSSVLTPSVFENSKNKQQISKSHGHNNSTSIKTSKFIDFSQSYQINLTKLPLIFRAQWCETSPDGQNSFISINHVTAHLTDQSEIDNKSTFSSNFDQLLDQSIVTDVEILCGSRKFSAHKYILASRSLYFAEKLMSTTDIIQISSNIDPNIFDKVLRILYFGHYDQTMTSDLSFNRQSSISDSNNVQNSTNSGPNNSNTSKNSRPSKKIDPNLAIINALKQLKIVEMKKEELKFTNDFMLGLLKSQKLNMNLFSQYKDITLRCTDGVEIACHKCVLCARIDYFKCMFGNFWAESTTNQQIYNLNFDSKIAEFLLHYVYEDQLLPVDRFSGDQNQNLDDLLNILCKLLVAADEFLLDCLRELCEIELCKLVSLKNVCELLEFARIYNASLLNTSCRTFICINLFSLIQTNQFLTLSRDALKDIENLYRCNRFNVISEPIKPFTHSGVNLEDLEIAYVTLKSCGVENFDEFTAEFIRFSLEYESNLANKFKKSISNVGKRNQTSKRLSEGDINEVSAKSRDDTQKSAEINDFDGRLNDSSAENRQISVEEDVSTPKTPEIKSIPIADRNKTARRVGAWSLDSTSPTDQFPMISLKEVMKMEEKAVEHNKCLKTTPLQTNPTVICQNSTTKKRGWNIIQSPPISSDLAKSPPSFLDPSKILGSDLNQKSKPAVFGTPEINEGSLTAIIKDEESSIAHRKEVLNKPLKRIQVEEQALQELLLAYNAENNFDECITVEHCSLGRVAEPTWQAHSSTSV